MKQLGQENQSVEKMPSVSVIVPLYHSREHFASLIKHLQPFFQHVGQDSELLLVNDGDRQLSPIAEYAAFRKVGVSVHVIQLKKNFGQMTATLCGVSKARCPIILTMDADTDCDLNELDRLILSTASPLNSVAYLDFQDSKSLRSTFRRFLSWSNTVWFRLVVGRSIKGHVGSSVRAFDRSLADRLLLEVGCAEKMDLWLLNNAKKVTFIPCPRWKDDESSYSVRGLLQFVFRFLYCLIGQEGSFEPSKYLYRTKKLII